MSRTVRDTNLDKPTARLRLAVRGKPHWRTLEAGLHLGYRRVNKGGGTWLARRFKGEGKYAEAKLGTADDLQAADGLAVLSFGQAQQGARTLVEGRASPRRRAVPRSWPLHRRAGA